MSDDPVIGKLYRHKELLYVMRVEARHRGRAEEWLSGSAKDGHKCVAPVSKLVPLKDDEARRIAPLFQTGEVIRGPWCRWAAEL